MAHHTIVLNCKSRDAAGGVVSLAKEAGVITRSDHRVTKQIVLVGTTRELVEIILAARRSSAISDTAGLDAASILLVDIIEAEPAQPKPTYQPPADEPF